MNYIHAKDSSIVEYPYSIEKLRNDNPQTSFPSVMSEEELGAWSVYPVTEEDAPAFNEKTESIELQAPVFNNGCWVRSWLVSPASQQEIELRTEAKSAQVRAQRDKTLLKTDFTQLQDFQGSAAEQLMWKEFRQHLRDLPDQAGFPFEINWPMPEDRAY